MFFRYNPSTDIFEYDTSGPPPDGSGPWLALPLNASVLNAGGIVNAQIAAGAAIVYSKLALAGAILNADLAGSIDWAKILKTGSSLADLATRSASDLGSGTLPLARHLADSVIQVVNGSTITEVTETGSTLVTTGLSQAITTKVVNSRVLILINQQLSRNGSPGADVELSRSTTQLLTLGVDIALGGGYMGVSHIDTPGSIGAYTYQTRFRVSSGSGTLEAQRNSVERSTITLIELQP